MFIFFFPVLINYQGESSTEEILRAEIFAAVLQPKDLVIVLVRNSQAAGRVIGGFRQHFSVVAEYVLGWKICTWDEEQGAPEVCTMFTYRYSC